MAIPNINCTCCGPPPCEVTITGVDDIANWTQVSGTWSNGTGNYVETSSANAIAYFNTAHPSSSSEGGLRFELSLPTTGVVRVLFAYQDADNHLYFEVERMGGACNTEFFHRLGARIGGADNTYEQYNGTYTTTPPKLLCYDGARFSISGLMDTPHTGTYGDYFAFQTIGITGTAGISVTDFYSNADGYCSGCRAACSWCGDFIGTGDGTPREISVYLEGVTNLNCADCVALFDTATIVFDASPAFGVPSSGTPDTDCEEFISRSCYFMAPTGCDAGAREAYSSLDIGLLVPGTGYEIRLSMIGFGSFTGADGRFSFYPSATNYCNQVLTDSAGVNVGLSSYGLAQQCDWTTCSAEITPNIT